jgi:hypothetical protein
MDGVSVIGPDAACSVAGPAVRRSPVALSEVVGEGIVALGWWVVLVRGWWLGLVGVRAGP